MNPKHDSGKKLELIEDFCRHFCIVCRKRIMVVCGTPVIIIGGCCSQIDDEEGKMIYIRTLRCHYYCFQTKRVKGKIKTRFKFEDIKKWLKKR